MSIDRPLRLTSIEVREIRMPLVQPYRISSGLETERRIILVRLTEEDGTCVWSECAAMSTPNYLPETVDTSWLALEEWLIPRVVGREFEHPNAVQPVLDRHIRGHNMAKAVLEMGIWALFAETSGTSLAELLGGKATAIDVGIALGIQERPDVLADVVARCREEGYRRVKVKIGPGKDVDYLQAAREAAGDNLLVMADANSAYTLADLQILKQIDALKLLMIEQPLAWDDFVEHAELQKQLETPVCLDESIRSVSGLQHMIALASGRIVNIKPGRVGGLAPALDICSLCVAHRVPAWCGGMLETGIGRAYNVALASVEGFILPGDISPSRRYWAEDIVEPEWEMSEDGTMRVPFDRPGLGVAVKTDLIEKYTTRCRSRQVR